jgi:rhamnosyltransferase
MKPRYAAVIATYNPDTKLVRSIRGLLAQTPNVLIVDDCSSDPATEAILEECLSFGCDVVKLSPNRGIARSLNFGVDWAISLNASHLLTLDQDTEIPDGYLQSIGQVYDACMVEDFRVGLVTAGSLNNRRRRPAYSEAGFTLGFDVMQSGSVFPIQVFNDGLRFREEFVIDCVDTDFCLNLRSKKYKVVFAPEVNIMHELGASKTVELFGKPLVFGSRRVTTSNHSKLRRYYMVRNRFVLYKEYGKLDRDWASRSKKSQVKDLILTFLFEQRRLLFLLSVARGISDGKAGRLGIATKSF